MKVENSMNAVLEIETQVVELDVIEYELENASVVEVLV